jgi:hypothetical protein
MEVRALELSNAATLPSVGHGFQLCSRGMEALYGPNTTPIAGIHSRQQIFPVKVSYMTT